MDGNRRWAKKRRLFPWLGHREGLKAAKRVVEFCLEKKIQFLSLYTFSIENFVRPAKELDYIFNKLPNELYKQIDELIEKGIRIRFIGDRSLFPASVVPLFKDIEEKTAHLHNITVNLLFCYGARQEIVHAIKNIVKKIKAGQISENELSDQMVSQHLWTQGIPDPELIIRTGGVKRLSNFLLYQAAYSEFYFIDYLWPEITHEHLEDALSFYKNCQRNFGK